jgi:predicted DNA binding CopG/RHH family protein
MNECLHQYTNDQEFEKYRQQRSKDFLQQIQEEE